MNKLLLLIFTALFLSTNVSGQNAKIVISGIVDGPLTGGTPKVLELYVRENIADLSNFHIGVANNGGGSDGAEFTLSGSAVIGDRLYLSTNADDIMTFFGVSADFVTGTMSVNGDDPVELYEGPDQASAVVIDTYGDVCCDGSGSAWDYLDGWAVRINIKTPTSPVFDPADWTFSGINALDGETSNATASEPFPIATLPVEFLSFTATKRNSQTVLSWVTATEINNDKFMIERSSNGQDFYDLGSVNGQGNSVEVNEYSFTDYSPVSGINYYRLKQMDFNGVFDYSAVVKIDIRTTGNTNIYPTVVSDYLTIENKEAADVKIFNVAGNLIYSATLSEATTRVDMTDYVAGTYFVSITNGATTTAKQIIKN